MTIGSKIAEKRKSKKVTQAALASAAGVTTAFISQIESGSRNPSYGLMIKIAHELQVPIEYLLSKETTKTEDPLDKFIFSTVPFLDSDNKKKVIDYIFQLSGAKYYKDIPFMPSPTEYAQYIMKYYKVKDVPVNVDEIAKKLGVQIYKVKIDDYEGILYKNQENPIILLNPELDNPEREKFTVAIMLGHLVLPWQLRQVFYRLKEKKSLEHEDLFEIEARQFAGEMIVPTYIVKKDFRKILPSIELFEKYSKDKYKCSMTALAHAYIACYGDKAIYITSNNVKFTRVYEKGFPYKLVDRVKDGSYAHSFVVRSANVKETRKGVVDGAIWFEDLPAGAKVIEESMLDPQYGITVTLLQIKHV